MLHTFWVGVQSFQAMFMEREGVTSHFQKNAVAQVEKLNCSELIQAVMIRWTS